MKRSNEEIFTDAYQNNLWNAQESRSAPGSNLAHTTTIRKELLILAAQLGVSSILDIPCGDFNECKG